MGAIRLVTPAPGSKTSPLQVLDSAAVEAVGDGDPHGEGVVWDDLLQCAESDVYLPLNLRLEWRAPEAPVASAQYRVRVAEDASFAASFYDVTTEQNAAHVTNLKVGTRYYWSVSARAPDGSTYESDVSSFVTHERPPRLIHAGGLVNCRDIGGWPLGGGRRIRQGMIYRSGEMNSHVTLTPAGIATLTDQLGMRTDLDLRGAEEDCAPALPEDVTRWVNVPTAPYVGIEVEQDYGREAYRRIFDLLADEAVYPLIFHCWGGCDRAGTVAFLVGGLMGMSMQQLCTDYEWSSYSIWGERTRDIPEFGELLESLELTLDSPDEDVREAVERYLLSIGVADGQIADIRRILLEDRG